MTPDDYRQEVLRVKDRLHSYCLWMLRDPDDACEVAQEAFMRLWQNRSQVKCESAKAWLLRTANRLCVDRLRLRKRRPVHVLEDAHLSTLDGDIGISGLDAPADLRPTIATALAHLSPNERAVIVLREIEGMSYEQMACVLERSLSCVKVTLHRARHRLRDQLSVLVRMAG